MAKPWYHQKIEEVTAELKTDISYGLTEAEVQKRRQIYGENELAEKAKKSVFLIFLNQFNDVLIWILIAAAIVSGLILKETIDSLAILVILTLMASLGFIQEYRAEKALEALKQLAAPTALVIREGWEKEVPSRDLVPGDLILLTGGDIIPADARVIEAASFTVDEASLTGESSPALKTVKEILKANLPIGDRDNMVFMGTKAYAGRAKAIVVETGHRTEMGKIAELIQEEEEKTPLQIELKRLGQFIAFAVISIALIVFLAGIIHQRDPVLMFLASVSLAVAAIPEGLPAIVTITLALGVQNMASKRAIVRKLHAVETLGSTTIICTDKTGTITLNQMQAEILVLEGKIWHLDKEILLSEVGDKQLPLSLKFLLKIAALNNDARRLPSGELVGDPTETALLRLSERFGIKPPVLAKEKPRLAEIPFDSARKRMTTIHKQKQGFLLLIKGAPEIIIERCRYFTTNNQLQPFTEADKNKILEINSQLARQGYRVLALAHKELETLPEQISDEIEFDIAFDGLVGLTDPPRPEVHAALQTTKDAKVLVSMVTGDHLLTAKAIAEKIDLLDDRQIVSGAELEAMTIPELSQRVEKIAVYARVDPAHKVKIINALKERGHIVAMTGDGVNDAPAVKRADIGISMGISGTDVTKEASDMILADDNFATIVSAIREGRLIFDNLKKFILFLLSCNISEVLIMFLTMLAGLPLPLLPIQILWINLVTDGLPALALGVDPPDPDLMKRPPRSIKESIVGREHLKQISWQGLLMTLGAIFAFLAILIYKKVPLTLANGAAFRDEIAIAQTATFTTMVLVQLFHSLNYRSEIFSLFSSHTFKNYFLLLAVAGSILLQLAVMYVPPLKLIFKTTSLGQTEWLIVLIAVLLPILIIDRIKVARGKRKRK